MKLLGPVYLRVWRARIVTVCMKNSNLLHYIKCHITVQLWLYIKINVTWLINNNIRYHFNLIWLTDSRCTMTKGRRRKKWYFWVVPTTKWPPPPLVVVKVPLFLWEIFYLLRIPWYGKIIEQIGNWNFHPLPNLN